MKDGFIKVGFGGYVMANRISAVQVADKLCRVLFESAGELCSLDEKCVSHEEALIHAERIVNDIEGMKKEGGAP